MAIFAVLVWTWAVALLATRHHLVGYYRVVQGAPWLWGAVALPVPVVVLILVAGTCLALLCVSVVRASGERCPRPIRWLLISSLVPALDLLRLLGIAGRETFLEPLLLAGVTGIAVGEMAAFLRIPGPVQRRIESIRWPLVVWFLAGLFGVWAYVQSVAAYDNFLLGFNDFGHFGQRVVNTWAGRGFLMETPSLPPFWDHFNPGLALLAPLWGLWPDPRLFMLIQAVCLALAAPIVYSIARRLGATTLESSMWAASYLLYPPLNQLNLGYSYGWHPVSLALPLLFLSILSLLKGQRMAAVVAALLACSFREDVVVIVGCLAAAMALQGWWMKWRGAGAKSPGSGVRIVGEQLPVWGWATLTVVSIVAFVLIFKFAGFSRFQVSRFDKLGDSWLEIVGSPMLRPNVFWGTVIRSQSAYFLLMLLVPLGLRTFVRGRWILLACLLPVGVLLAWDHLPSTSIAFQYTTTMIPVLFLAAMVGAKAQGKRDCSAAVAGPMWQASATALAGCAAASLWFGAVPWCPNTLTDVFAQTYGECGVPHAVEDRFPGADGIKALHEVVALVNHKDARVLATGRIASHLLGVERLDTVGQSAGRWAAFEEEAGPGHSGIELFDWVVLDTYERFQQSGEDIVFVGSEAERAGYRVVESQHGILVLARPGE